MSVVEFVAAGVANRQRSEISRWQKAQEMMELQQYLRSVGRPHSTRDLSVLTGVARSTITEQLVISEELSTTALQRFGIEGRHLAHLPHSELIRLAKLPPYLRAGPLRQLAKQVSSEPTIPLATPSAGARVPNVREERRAAAYSRMRD